MSIRHLAASASPDDIAAALTEDGAAIVDDLYAHQSELVTRVLDSSGTAGAGNGAGAANGAVEAWVQARAAAVERAQSVIADIKGAGQADLAMLDVANRQLRSMMA